MIVTVPQEKTFIIAEAGINHNGDLQIAKDLVYAAKESGADAVKFQTYLLNERSSPKSKYYDLFKRCKLSYKQFVELNDYANEIGIEFFSTPFGTKSLDFLVGTIGVKRIKLASFDVTNMKFLDEVRRVCLAKSSLSVIMSVGMANHNEVLSALKQLNGVNTMSLLHCISSYPTPEDKTNLLAIRALSNIQHTRVTNIGYSDHTAGIAIPALAVLVGATVIEKHFTLDLNGQFVDNPISANPKMLREMVNTIREYENLLGDGIIDMKDIEMAATAFRRKTK